MGLATAFSSRRLRQAGAALLTLAACAFATGTSNATIVERVVAVVGERPILLSELRQRARPHVYRIVAQTQNPTQQAAAETQMFRELLNRMIEERLEEQAADKAHLTVTPEEVDQGVRQVAAQQKMSAEAILAEAKRSGLTEQDYRDEIRRQVLEGKLIQLRVRGRVRITEQDARAAYAHWAKELGEQSPVDLRILVLQIPPGASAQQLAARQTLGEELTRRARAGEDFCELVSSYSEDPTTKGTCGSRGPLAMQALFPELQQAAATLKPGEFANPILFRDPSGNQAFLVVQLAAAQPKLPAYDAVHDQMMERAFVEATERQRKLWLQELRRGLYIDVRL